MDWGAIDSFNVITVNGSTNLEGFLENVEKVGLKDRVKVHTFAGVSGKNDGEGVCSPAQMCIDIFRTQHRCCNAICRDIARNHKSIIKEAFEAGHDNVAIFEDDARFVELDSKRLQNILDFIKKGDYDVFYFGHCPVIPVGYPVSQNIVRTYYPGLFHAYVVNRRAMSKILEIDDCSYIDLVVGRDLGLKKYGAYPSVNYQVKGPGVYTSMKVSKLLHFNTVNAVLEKIQYYGLVVLILLVVYYFNNS